VAGKKGMWNWLQPYAEDEDGAVETKYNAFPVGEEGK
jgi:hypothetical protein